ncbi:MAG TPA: hypothetical protein VD966_13725, partial [Pyrinomonadaceae bacterium]|nr:hypothetical protein [Pyrinomonadaceae bacterium]
MKRLLPAAAFALFAGAQIFTSQAQTKDLSAGAAARGSEIKTSEEESARPAPDAPRLTKIYRVGVGDVLDIHLLNANSRESTLFTVMPGGLLEYPLAGEPLQVA